VQEITEIAAMRRHLERQLRESEARFRAIFERAGIGISLTDESRRVIRTNPALRKMLGYGERELRRMVVEDYTHPADLARDLALFEQLMSGRRSAYSLEKRFIRKDRGVVWGSATTTAVRDVSGKALFAIQMIEDISERKRAERALWQHTERLQLLHEVDRSIRPQSHPAGVGRRARLCAPLRLPSAHRACPRQ
jgi:PAS domain S-box-containing protein